MFIILLRFSDNKAKAPELMAAHNAWIKQGFDDDVFLLVGSIEPAAGGAIVAHNADLDAITSRVNDDPFVAENVVSAEIMEISPKKADQRFNFLLSQG